MDDYIILDLNKTREKFRSNKPTYVRQGEVDSQPLAVQIVLDGEPYDLTGCHVYFEAERSDGRKFAEEASITSAENGFVAHTVPAGLMLAFGKTELAYFAVYTPEDEIITTETMDIVTLQGICMFSDSDYMPYIERVIAELEGYLENATALTDTVEWLVAEAQRALSDVNEAMNRADASLANCEAATSDAQYYADVARVASANVAGMVGQGLKDVTAAYLAETQKEAVGTLARNTCTSGMLIDGTWYVKSDMAYMSDGMVRVTGANLVDGRMLLPTRVCGAERASIIADAALERADAALMASERHEAVIADLKSMVESAMDAIATLAMHLSTYPFVLGGTVYVRGTVVSGGVVTVPNATYSSGRMKLNPM